MLAQSHRYSDVVQILQAEKKRRSSWFPPISDIWGLLYGRAGNSKCPLAIFMVSVLLWGYPMYIIRVILQKLETSMSYVIVIVVHSNNMEFVAWITLLLHLLEYSNVDLLDYRQQKRSWLRGVKF